MYSNHPWTSMSSSNYLVKIKNKVIVRTCPASSIRICVTTPKYDLAGYSWSIAAAAQVHTMTFKSKGFGCTFVNIPFALVQNLHGHKGNMHSV